MLLVVLALMGLLPGASETQAASLTINPTSFQLTPKRPSAVMQVTNQSAVPVRLQVQILAWNTDGKAETLTETDQLMVNPPLFMLGGHETQFIRFGARDVAQSSVERCYRLIIEEVPGAPDDEHGGLHTLLKISTPIFIPALEPVQQVDWRIVRSRSGSLLVAANAGNTHLKIITLKLAGKEAGELLINTHMAYILPGQAREWPINHKVALTGPLQMRVQTETGIHEQTLSSGAP